jgi:putative transposase
LLMPWKEQRKMGQKLEFVERAEQGESVTVLCRTYGISRQTGHKWLRRYKELGADGLEEESRRPKTAPLSTAESVVIAILEAREAHSTWGPRKLADLLRPKLKAAAPSARTIARVLKRADKVRQRRRLRPLNVVERAPNVVAQHPNDVWTVDFKGWWRAANGERCDPLTIRDAKSRFILAIKLCPQDMKSVKSVFHELFKKHGVPRTIQCDNGVPFISVRARAGLTALSAWWISLGIQLVRSRPGCPQDNGGHERMHRDMKDEVQSRPARDIPTQQRVLDRWRQTFNYLRPHEALKGKTPAEVYKVKEPMPYRTMVYVYPFGTNVVYVSSKGVVRINGANYFLSQALACEEVAIEPTDDLNVRAWFHGVDLGLIEIEPKVDEDVFTNFRRMKASHKLAA